MIRTASLASAGFLATAVAFGPARMGYGLFLPELRQTFSLSSTQAGLIASAGFLGFLLALPAAAWLGGRIGQRVPIAAGALLAALGCGLVAAAPGVSWLAAGIALAGTSAGLCWAPFNDAAERVTPASARPGMLSAVSTGTAAGVMAAAALFLAVALGSLDWRLAWTGFALLGLCALLLTFHGVPPGRAAVAIRDRPGKPALLRAAVVPLYGAAVCFGVANAAYLSFAADHVAAAGGLAGLPDRAGAAVIFLVYGLFGLGGLATGRVEARLGIGLLMSVIFAAFAVSIALIALVPQSWAAVLSSAALHGAGVMTISAALSFWSLRLFPGRASAGFTVALFGVAASSVAAPVLAGMLADAAGMGLALLVTAAVPLGAALAFGAAALRQRA